MEKKTVPVAADYIARRRRRRVWKRVVTALACIVVLCTMSALTHPAITLEQAPQCGKEEHIHEEECYIRAEEAHRTAPVCTPESLGLHTHTEACLDENGEYVCGCSDFVLHTHDDVCFDGEGNLWCQLPERKAHIHDESCYAQPAEESAEPPLMCVQEELIAHEHSEECYNENSNLICGRTQVLEHVHTEVCFQTGETPAPVCGLEEHTHSAACKVIGLIEALPDRQCVEERVAAFEEAGDEAGGNAYLTELQGQLQQANDAYAALPEEEQAKVTNIDRLTELEWLRGLSLQETAAVTVTDENHSSAVVTVWTDEEGKAQNHLQAALFSFDQGYTIRSVEYYQITGLTGTEASVTYHDGGLSAANGEKVFVYDLGVDGAASPQSCPVKNILQNEAAGLFTSFTFSIPASGEEAPHIYAFVSASSATLEEMGIYLGMEQDGVWVAYDGAAPENANVKATVNLSVPAPEGYRLFIRRINEGERYYPSEKAVNAKAGKVNGWQCYTIRWIKQNVDGSLDMLPLNKNGPATVQIEYLNENARLSGPAGARKLLIFNSNADGSLVDQVADSVENVRVDDVGYTSFTFHAEETGPYVFASKWLEKGYIDYLSINKEKSFDGSAPFDKDDGIPGYDSGPHNGIVRSYDTVQYLLEATLAAREEGITETEVKMFFELTLGKSATAARFDISKMLWVGENYSIEYLDSEDQVIMIMAHNGKYYPPQLDENGNVRRDENGFALADTSKKTVSMNAQVSGSTAGVNSYKVSGGGVAKQRLVGWATLRANDGENILSGTQSFTMAVEVRNADHGEIFAPTFKLWLEGNEDNYGSEGGSDGVLLPAQPDLDNVMDISDPKNKGYQITVSAGAYFNIQVKRNNDMSYKNWFDFSTGLAVKEPVRSELVRLASLEENHGKSNPAAFTVDGAALSPALQEEYANYRYGRITCYGITLQLYSNTDNEPDANRAAKGFRGLSLPVGDITFDLNFASEAYSKVPGVDPNEYTAILWDYNENIPANSSYSYDYVDPGRGRLTTPKDGLGNGGRNIYWDGENRSPYAKGGAPSNYMVYHDGCYYGGDWAIVDENGQKADIKAVAHPAVVTGTGGGAVYHFSVSDYDFDFDGQHFPSRDAGNSGNIPGYDTYARGFSAGCVQVLSVFPMVQKVDEVEIFLDTKASNLQLTTRAGQKLEAQLGDTSQTQHEVNAADNIRRDQIVLYAPGNLTKGSAFNGRYKGNPPVTTSQGFLGTDYWTNSYDCSTFAGDEIWITSYGMLASGSDFRMRSMNLLQLFDSRALRICGTPDVCQDWNPLFDSKGESTFLYAADPDYPGGYDTNHQDQDGQYDVLAYMNTVREEDLRYFTSLDELETAGYTCVGVLMELRRCDLLGGKYQYMRIPVQVNGNDERLVGKTVATVNTFRIWSEDLGHISWSEGQWNGEKNELRGFSEPQNAIVNGVYSGELVNGIKSPPAYVKTEYKDGLQVKGTHTGGTLAGNSLLILSYEAGINIGVDNKTSGSMISYNLGDGESVVDYRLKNIRTVLSDLTGQTDHPTTTLTIRTVLDEDNPRDKQRISVSGGSYRIVGYAVDANGNVAKEETNIAIGSDPEHPTELVFAAKEDRKPYRIKIHAIMGANSQSVSFVIQDAPVGIQLPDITFQANFAAVTALRDNDTVKTSTYISGQGDNRAYDKAKGNTDHITVGVVMRSSTNLTKAVNRRYIELDGIIIYDVTYTNSGTDRIDKIYFYDLLPHKGDIRGSEFEGTVVLREVDVTSSSKKNEMPAEDGTIAEDTVPPADAIVYYSTTEYWELYNTVKVFGGTVLANGKIEGMNEENVENMLENGKDQNHNPLFQILGRVSNGVFAYDSSFDSVSDEEKTELMSSVTGLYIKVENLNKGQTVNMQIAVQTKDNAADNWYKNIANSWIAGSKTLSLTSNKVETQVVSRSISGVVWYDRNLDGIRDEDEPLIQGVTATLFKKGQKEYEPCTVDVTGNPLSPVTTGKNGAYAFDRLSAGEYIVAFSGEALGRFTDATTYQKNRINDANTNDGRPVASGKGGGFDPNAYIYYIQYSMDSDSMNLHAIGDMGSVSLVNGVEAYANQDLGLIIAAYELPKTGGTGVTMYTLSGLLTLCAGALLLYGRKKRGKTNSAS